MELFTTLLPITVIVAITLFFLKEVIEGLRRWRANVRRGRAFSILLARECELNHWVHKCINEVLVTIKADIAEEDSAEYTIERRSSGDVFFRREYSGGWNVRGLPGARTNVMRDMMLEVAALNPTLFNCLEAAYDSAINLSHLRDSLITFIEKNDEDNNEFLSGFIDYGLRELTDVLADLNNLYRECTAEELRNIRVR